jgi:NDP-sugar pyrophosphorylase family protein
MKSNVTALILCGGKGERLRPLTESTPKPLVCINSRPILSYLLDHIKSYEISEVVVATGYLSDKIKEFFESSYTELNVKIVNSGDADILERINSCVPYIEGDFIVFYGDTLANIDLQALQDFHYGHDKKITMTLWPLKSDFGLVELDSNNVVKNFQEKPTLDKWINIGGFYYQQEAVELLDRHSNYANFLSHASSISQIKGYKHAGIHITVNTLHELEKAKENINLFE